MTWRGPYTFSVKPTVYVNISCTLIQKRSTINVIARQLPYRPDVIYVFKHLLSLGVNLLTNDCLVDQVLKRRAFDVYFINVAWLSENATIP